MGPTCSIIYENEPIEPGTMQRPPRKAGLSFLSLKQLSVSIIQGLMITAGCLGIGYYYLQLEHDHATIRSIIFITLLFSNIFLTLVNRSFVYPVFKTLTYKNNLVPLITCITLSFIVALLYVPFVRDLFRLNSLSLSQIAGSVVVALISTLWIDVWKLLNRGKQ